jgi:transposase-like protein
MVEYKCNLCNKIFNKKSTFIDHQLRKRPCNNKNIIVNQNIISDHIVIPNKSLVISKFLDENIDNNINKNNILQSIINIINNNKDVKNKIKNKDEVFKCKNCDIKFTLKTNLYRHMRNSCNKKKEDSNNLILEKIDDNLN